jgi:Tfp pilus assembly protein PilO
MQWLNIIYYVIAPMFVTYVGYSMKSHVDRIESMEKKLSEKLDEPQVRLLMADKIDPIKEDIKEIKEMLNHILTVIMKNP